MMASSVDVTAFLGCDGGQQFARTWVVEEQGDDKPGRDRHKTRDRGAEP